MVASADYDLETLLINLACLIIILTTDCLLFLFSTGNHLPEWSVDESNEQDVVGTFDSSGAFLEPKVMCLCLH